VRDQGRPGARRLFVVAIAAAVVSAAVALAAAVDHTVKGTRMNRAEVHEWMCAHHGVECGHMASADIEAGWNARERFYVGAVGALGGLAVVTLGLGTAASTRRPPPQSA
jgi:hypothetical protein